MLVYTVKYKRHHSVKYLTMSNADKRAYWIRFVTAAKQGYYKTFIDPKTLSVYLYTYNSPQFKWKIN